MTLYRTSGDSPVVEHLIRAAEAGKQVAVVVELKARFDEAANIGWARRLEDAGVHVAYGLVGLKVHTKTLLVVRAEPEGVHRYCHVGTGNYNAKTARLYTDFGLLTSDPDIGHDLSQLFNGLTGYGRHLAYRKLVVAPEGLRSRITDLIRNEAEHGPDGHIAMKMNSLVDADMIDEIYMAAQAGVRVDLLIRGICCLRPGVPGLSETITVRSLIGRFLEHPRVFRFAHGDGPGRPVHLIGSADLMPRNLDRRVEALTPIEHPALRARLDELFQLQLADRWLAWDLDASGSWIRCAEDPDDVVAAAAHRVGVGVTVPPGGAGVSDDEPEVMAGGGVVIDGEGRVAGGASARVTTTGRSRRASSTRARRSSSVRCARSPRRRDCAVASATRSRPPATSTTRAETSSCGTG